MPGPLEQKSDMPQVHESALINTQQNDPTQNINYVPHIDSLENKKEISQENKIHPTLSEFKNSTSQCIDALQKKKKRNLTCPVSLCTGLTLGAMGAGAFLLYYFITHDPNDDNLHALAGVYDQPQANSTIPCSNIQPILTSVDSDGLVTEEYCDTYRQAQEILIAEFCLNLLSKLCDLENKSKQNSGFLIGAIFLVIFIIIAIPSVWAISRRYCSVKKDITELSEVKVETFNEVIKGLEIPNENISLNKFTTIFAERKKELDKLPNRRLAFMMGAHNKNFKRCIIKKTFFDDELFEPKLVREIFSFVERPFVHAATEVRNPVPTWVRNNSVSLVTDAENVNDSEYQRLLSPKV